METGCVVEAHRDRSSTLQRNIACRSNYQPLMFYQIAKVAALSEEFTATSKEFTTLSNDGFANFQTFFVLSTDFLISAIIFIFSHIVCTNEMSLFSSSLKKTQKKSTIETTYLCLERL